MTPCAQDAKPAESGSPSGAPLPGQEPAAFLIPLLQALSAQTAAMSRLAASNEGLSQAVLSMIEEMTRADEQDSDDEPRSYMDGSPVR